VVLLLVRCGEEAAFMSNYSAQILAGSINVVAVYDSVQCAALVNYNAVFMAGLTMSQMSSYAYLYKLVPYDSSLNASNYANFTAKLTAVAKANLTDPYTVRIFFF
jgi:hypothetical protein